MLDSINGDVVISEVAQPEVEQKTNKNISYRGTDFERTPESDSFEGENKNNTGKVIGITAGVLAAVALTLGAICYSKGKGADGVEKKFGERMKDGWRELWHKSEKKVKETTESAQEAASEIKNDAEQAIDKTKDEVNGKDLKEHIGNEPPKTQKAEETVADEIKNPVVETVVTKAERSFENIAKEAKENISQLDKRAQEIEKEFSQYETFDKIPGEMDFYERIHLKNEAGVTVRTVKTSDMTHFEITYYDPLNPKVDKEHMIFDKSTNKVTEIYQRVGDTNEFISYRYNQHEVPYQGRYERYHMPDESLNSNGGEKNETVDIFANDQVWVRMFDGEHYTAAEIEPDGKCSMFKITDILNFFKKYPPSFI